MSLQNIIKKIKEIKNIENNLILSQIYELISTIYSSNNIFSSKITYKLNYIFNFFIDNYQHFNKSLYVYFFIYLSENIKKNSLVLKSLKYLINNYFKNVSIHKTYTNNLILKFDISILSNINILIREIKTNSQIINVKFLSKLKTNKIIVRDSLSISNEPRRLLYGWNKSTGDQLHKYLPPNFDEHTKKINEYIRTKQNEYYVAIIDDGCITNYRDYKLIINQSNSFCRINKEKTTRYYDDFINNDDNKHFNNNNDKRKIIIKDYFNSTNQMKLQENLCNTYNLYNSQYGDHGTRVISSLCGYKNGIAPNVNFISYSVLDSHGELRSNMNDVYTDIENEINTGKEIIAINKSLGPQIDLTFANSYITEVEKSIIETNNTDNKFLPLDLKENNIVYSIACGNDNNIINDYSYLKPLFDINLNNKNNGQTNLIGYSNRFGSKSSDYKSLLTLIAPDDDQLCNDILSVGSFDIFYKEIEDYSNSGHPYFYYSKPDLVAPSTCYHTDKSGQIIKSSGTSFSSPMITGLVVLVRCLLDYLIECHNFDSSLKNYDRIIFIIKESCIMFSNTDNNIFYTKFDQGNGFPTLFNVYKYLKSQNKDNFTSPFYNNSIIKTTYEFIDQDKECEDENKLDSNECLEYAYNFVTRKEREDYSSDKILSQEKDSLKKESYSFNNKYQDNSQCFYNLTNKNVSYKKNKNIDEKYICKNKKILNNDSKNLKCYKKKIEYNINNKPIIQFYDNLVDKNKNYILEDCKNIQQTNDTNTFYCKNMNCLGKCNNKVDYAVNKYGICRKRDKNFNKKEIILLIDSKYRYIFYIGLFIFITCIIISIYKIIKR